MGVIVGDLFSGIGGFSLAAHWHGWSTAWFSEIDPYACRVLAKHWPDVPNLGDITKVDWSTVPPVDVLTGGFPCQPHSLAGKRLASSDERDLFDEIIRCAGVLRPRYLLLENVPGLLTSESGRFFGRVLGALAALGYDAEWRVLSAADVGAPHRRERVWIVAYAQCGWRRESGVAANEGRQPVFPTLRREGACGAGSGSGHVGDSDSGRREQRDARVGSDAVASARFEHVEHAARGGRGAGPELAARRADGGCAGLGNADTVVGWLDAVAVRGADGTVRRIPREAAEGGPESALWPVAHGVSGRVARLRGIGNSIVPRCAYEVMRTIVAMEQARVAA